ncbi:unnamed protein product, partial [marine sediment metagenome]
MLGAPPTRGRGMAAGAPPEVLPLPLSLPLPLLLPLPPFVVAEAGTREAPRLRGRAMGCSRRLVSRPWDTEAVVITRPSRGLLPRPLGPVASVMGGSGT